MNCMAWMKKKLLLLRAMRIETHRRKTRREARNSLPDDLKPVFDEFIADYRYAATVRHGKPYISYIVAADIVRAGWRRTAEPITEKK